MDYILGPPIFKGESYPLLSTYQHLADPLLRNGEYVVETVTGSGFCLLSKGLESREWLVSNRMNVTYPPNTKP